MHALELSKRYFNEIALPCFKEDFHEIYKYTAAGLVGNGSECFGYDDELSMDHDWGIDFFIWLPYSESASVPIIREWKSRLFQKYPPDFIRKQTQHGACIDVMTIDDFYRSLIGFPNGPASISEWRKIPEENLAMSVNGAIFIDNSGDFSRIRKYLQNFYPEDLRKKRIAAKCIALAQTGQYNHLRTARRSDWVTLRHVLARFHDAAVSIVFLLNNSYRPYYKWAFRRMKELPVLGNAIALHLQNLALANEFDEKGIMFQHEEIECVCKFVAEELRRQDLSASHDEFLVTHGEEVQGKIKDESLSSLPAQIYV